MFSNRLMFIIFAVWLFASQLSLAQAPQLNGPLTEIRVTGTTQSNLVSTIIRSRVNTQVEQINLESERNLVLQLGIFSEVTVRLEEQPTGIIMLINVRENPRISEVRVEGSSIISDVQWRQALSSQLIEAGQPLNNKRAEDAMAGIQQTYTERGFPFTVDVTLDISESEVTSEQPETTVSLLYTVNESAPIDEIIYEANTVLEQDSIDRSFLFLKDQKEFQFLAYQETVREISQNYADLGYRLSGVDTSKTTLSEGVLTVVFREFKISALDTTAIGISPSEFSLKVGDLYNYDVLLEDIKRLSRGRDNDIGIDELPLATGDVRITFRAGPPGEAGVITAIEIEGNTVISSEEIIAVLKLELGDNFTSALANEDFTSIFELYRDRGYSIAQISRYNYLDGTYIQRIIEHKIAEYELVFDTPNPDSKDFTILRYLPKLGTVLNSNSLRQGLLNVARGGAIEVQGATPLPTANPEEIILQLNLKELPTARFQPGLVYETSASSSEFNLNAEFTDTNFLGRLHDIGAGVTAQTSDIGFLFGASLSYSIPWLYIDEFDFKDVPTRFSARIFSDLETDQVLSKNGDVSVCLDGSNDNCEDEQKVLVGQYTRRDTGLSLGVGRQVLPFTQLSVSLRGAYSDYSLEPGKQCSLNDQGELVDQNNNKVTDGSCALPQAESVVFLPQSGWNGYVGTGITFDNRDNPNFPREGVSANADIGIGFGSDYRSPITNEQSTYNYIPAQFGVRTYLRVADLLPDFEDNNHVLAFKVTAGHQFGNDYPSNRYYVVGDSFNQDTSIRGYRRADVNRSQSYAIGTLEYRYDFNLDTFATQTVIAYGFADIGWASSVPSFENYQTPLLAGAGLGAQLNLGLAGIALPAIRLEYAFSETNPSGVFRFKVGPVF